MERLFLRAAGKVENLPSVPTEYTGQVSVGFYRVCRGRTESRREQAVPMMSVRESYSAVCRCKFCENIPCSL